MPADDVPAGHTAAVADVPADLPVVKYGRAIGVAKGGVRAESYGQVHDGRHRPSGGLVESYPHARRRARGRPKGTAGRAGVRNEGSAIALDREAKLRTRPVPIRHEFVAYFGRRPRFLNAE